MTRIERNVEEFRRALESFNSKKIDTLANDFEAMLTNHIAPYKMWEIKGYGAFKECYEVGEDNFIIKFAAAANETATEEETLNAAIEAGLSDLFPRTIYIPLSTWLPSSIIEYDSFSSSSCSSPSSLDTESLFTYVIIQSKVAETADSRKNNLDLDWIERAYYRNPIMYNNEPVSYSLLWDTGFSSRSWMEDVINIKGYDYFVKLADFISAVNIRDLHNKNIGYGFNGEPLIFDWFSNQLKIERGLYLWLRHPMRNFVSLLLNPSSRMAKSILLLRIPIPIIAVM